jgi:hypothetical protein
MIEFRRQANPYARTIEGSGQWATFSFIDFAMKRKERMFVATLIALVRRAIDEYKAPKGIPIVPIEDYLKNPSLADPPKDAKGKALDDYLQYKKGMKERCIIARFWASLMQFDPEKHAHPSYVPDPNDPSRKIIDTPAADLAIAHGKRTNPKLREKMRIHDENEIAEIIKKEDAKLEAEGKKSDEPLIIRKSKAARKRARQKRNRRAKAAAIPRNRSEIRERSVREIATNMIPPIDLYERIDFFMKAHWDELNEVVDDLIGYKRQYDRAINVYAVLPSKEKATMWMEKHAETVMATVYMARTGNWTIFDARPEIQQTIQFFNKNTKLMKEMIDHHERDEKIGRDMMKKTVRSAKRKNVEEEGDVDPAFLKYASQINTEFKKQGVTHIDQDEFTAADLPDNAVQVNYFGLNESGRMETGHFFTEADNPEDSDTPQGVAISGLK